MKKIIVLILLVAAAAGAAWYFLSASTPTENYTADVSLEVDALKMELAGLETALAANTLTTEAATAAKVSIIGRLATIESQSVVAEGAVLTADQRTRLVKGLNDLKQILISYRDTISAVDAAADETVVAAELAKRHNGTNRTNKNIHQYIVDTIDTYEETVQDTVQDYQPNQGLDDTIDNIVIELDAEAAAAANETNAATSTDEVATSTSSTTADTADETGDTTKDEVTDTETEDTTTDTTDDDTSAEIEIHTDTEVETEGHVD